MSPVSWCLDPYYGMTVIGKCADRWRWCGKGELGGVIEACASMNRIAAKSRNGSEQQVKAVAQRR